MMEITEFRQVLLVSIAVGVDPELASLTVIDIQGEPR